MSKYLITFARSVRKELEALDGKLVNKIFPKIENLSIEPRRILSCIGKRVFFKYPGNKGDKHGILQDRVVLEEDSRLCNTTEKVVSRPA